MTEFFHASRRTGHKGTAARHSAYITRAGSFAWDRPADLVCTFSANMPEGVEGREFWATADRQLRKKGIAYQGWDVAFPRVLEPEQNAELLKDLALRLANGKPVEAAFHCPLAALEGGEQPHGHFMIYDYVEDGISRPLDQMFRRFNPVNPAAGGCRKVSAATPEDVRQKLREDRQACAEVINRHLEMHGFQERVDHRSNEERGLGPRRRDHLGPAGVAKLRKSVDGE